MANDFNRLDLDGLKYLWDKITDKFALKTGTLKNPKALTIKVNKGNTVYDGSEDKTVDIDGKIDEIYNELKAGIDSARINGARIYGVKWDGVNVKMSRLYDAYDITTDTSNFCYKGTINSNYSNPFDSIYPWSEMAQCNVDLNAYRSLEEGADIRDAVTAWYGDPDFTTHGSASNFVGVYVPEFWHFGFEDNDGNWVVCVADKETSGFIHSKPHIQGIGFAIDDGSGSKVTCGDGQPLTNIAVSTIHSRAKAAGFTLRDIYQLDAITALYLVEYANMNSQQAIGDGCSSLYRQNASDKPLIAKTGATSVVLPKACAAYCVEGATLDFGASNGAVVIANRRTITGYTQYSMDANYIEASFDGGTLDITTAMFCSFHGRANDDSFGNKSGYLGTAGKNNAYYRGIVAYANRYSYTLGIYRQSGTGKIWLCDPETTDNYDALNTADHHDTGMALPDVVASWQYIKKFGDPEGLLSAFRPVAEGGANSSTPVGDAQYVPVIGDANRVLLFGGGSNHGARCGVFCGSWIYAASTSDWFSAGLPVLKSP